MARAAADHPGRRMAGEVQEQPDVWRRILAEPAAIVEVAGQLVARRPRFVLLVARGTSDHAALYAKYLIEITQQLPAGLVSPSTMTAYGARPRLEDVLLIAVSQSGGSPDLVRTVEIGREQGAATLAVTNNARSPLAQTAELHLDIRGGTERAVAATKSYTAQLLTLYLLFDRMRGGDGQAAARLPEWGQALLAQDGRMAEIAQRYRFAQRLVVTARGYSYATAREAALKLMETSYISAQAFSGADLLHGPLAMIDREMPVLAVVPEGIGGALMRRVLPRLSRAGADVFCVGDRTAVPEGASGLALPEGVPEEISPILEILPLQMLALHLAVARGGDPDAPRGLSKVTATL
ncbi:MAG: SIS domain-containing protein [Acetobacteraceae bacterium]